ncbi:MAG: amidohydrolase family protein [Candidatus Binatia bacterium]|nr:amidohydrolase family protein [Candidatus Binatia bacterium]
MATETNDPYVLISADCHAGARISGYRDYLEEKYLERFDAWREKYRNPNRSHLNKKKDKTWGGEERVKDLESQGVVAEVLFPNNVPPFFPPDGIVVSRPPTAEEYELRLQGVRAHNRWLSDWCADYPTRRAGVGVVLLNDIDDALEDIEWIAKHELKGGVLISQVADDTDLEPLYSPVYERIWAACQDNDLIIHQHSGGGCPNYGNHPASSMVWVYEMSWFATRGLSHLILAGVFERYPKLRYLISESGCAWVKQTMEHMDHLWKQIAKAGSTGEVDFTGRGVTKEPPSHYAKTNCWYGASFPRPADLAGRHLVGLEHVLWGADYPHYEGTYPYTMESLRLAFSDIDPSEVRMMVGENAAKFFGFDMEELKTYAATCGPTVDQLREPLLEKPKDATSPCFW